ncbi:hypothetical protein E4U53_006622 [Claviceps sorghi]|nr:hypothetical protein E4U53_006622 [Claviceps sorghi]
MHPLVTEDVKDGQKNQARRAGKGTHDAQADEGLFAARPVGHQPAAVAEPALGEKGQVESHDGEARAGDEEGLERAGADVTDVGDGGVGGHGRVAGAVGGDDPVEEHGEEHGEPDKGGEDGEELSC